MTTSQGPTGRSHDLTARVAASRPAPDASGKPQVLLIDDQPHQVLPWLERVLAEYTLLPISNEDELRRLLAGQVLEKLPPGPYRPIAALVDLDLGAGGGSGLGAIRLLRAHPTTAASTTAVLFTNGLAGRDDRDLLAVLSAYANGCGLLASTKDEPDGPRLRTVLKAAEVTATAGGALSPERPLGGLRYVPDLKLRSVHTQRPPRDLVELLLGEPGLRALWGSYADCGADFDEAVNRTRDQFPDFLRRGSRLPRPGSGRARPANSECPHATGSGGSRAADAADFRTADAADFRTADAADLRTADAADFRTADTGGTRGAPERTRRVGVRCHLANDLLTKRDFGELFLSWHMYGDSFFNVPGQVMEPQGLGDEDEYRQHSARRRLMLGMFFARYGRLLMSAETHAFAEEYMMRKEAQ